MTNKYNVQKKQWKKWSEPSQEIFNSLFGYMMENQPLFSHPEAPSVDNKYWKTTCWNAAWTAAEIHDGR